MAFDWASFLTEDIHPVIEEMGQDLTLKHITKNDDDIEPWKPHSVATESETSETVKGVVYDFDMNEQFEPGTMVQAGDRLVIISAKDLVSPPGLDDRMVVDGEEWDIVAIPQKINPAGTAIAYVLQVRR